MATPTSNVPPLYLEHQQRCSGTGKASTRRFLFRMCRPTFLRRADKCQCFRQGTGRSVSGLLTSVHQSPPPKLARKASSTCRCRHCYFFREASAANEQRCTSVFQSRDGLGHAEDRRNASSTCRCRHCYFFREASAANEQRCTSFCQSRRSRSFCQSRRSRWRSSQDRELSGLGCAWCQRNARSTCRCRPCAFCMEASVANEQRCTSFCHSRRSRQPQTRTQRHLLHGRYKRSICTRRTRRRHDWRLHHGAKAQGSIGGSFRRSRPMLS